MDKEDGMDGDVATQIFMAVHGEELDKILVVCARNENQLTENGWAILNHLNERIADMILNPTQGRVYSSLLEYLLQHSNPRELIFAFLEACQGFQNQSIFYLTVPALGRALISLPKKQRSLDVVCSTLFGYVQSCSWSADDYVVTENEDNALTAEKKTDATVEIIRTISTIIEYIVLPMAKDIKCLDDGGVLTACIVKLLHYPLLYILYDREDQLLVQCYESIFHALIRLNPTLSVLLKTYANSAVTSAFDTSELVENPVGVDRSSAFDDGKLLILGVANLVYHIYFEGLEQNNLPHVFTAQYILTLCLPCLVGMFTRSSNVVVALKANRLLEALLKRVAVETLNKEFLDQPSIKGAVAFICWSMQFSELLSSRQCAARLLPLLISRFDRNAKFYILLSILNTEVSPEVLSYTYTLIKDFIHSCWTSQESPLDGSHSLRLMEKIFRAPDGEEGNLITDLNKISSALNLARYLILRDKRRIAVYTKQMNKYIESYIKPVGMCLKTEMERMESRLKAIHSGDYKPAEVELTVAGETLQNSIAMEEEAIAGVINRLHLVLYVYNCVEDMLKN